MRETVLNMFVYDGTFPKFGQSGLKTQIKVTSQPCLE